VGEGNHWYFSIDDVEFGFRFSDRETNPIGASRVPFTRADDLATSRDRLVRAGCAVHRPSLSVNDSRRICPVVEPFANTLGLDGP